MKKSLLFSLLLLTGIIEQAAAKDGYKIQIKFKNTDDSMVFLAHYFGKPLPTIYKTDSARIDKNGVAKFESNTETLGGIYMLLLSNRQTYFEFLLNNGDDFSVTADVKDLPVSIEFKNTSENKDFMDYTLFLKGFGEKMQSLNSRFEVAKSKEDSSKIQEEIAASSKNLTGYRKNYVSKNPNTLLAGIFNALELPKIPEGKHLLPNGKDDSMFAYNYYKSHYWDYFNFKDDRLINTPVYDARIDEYMNKLVAPTEDSVIKEGDMLLEKTRGQKELFKYTLFWLTRNAENSKIMGMDRVFVYLVENYYMKGDAYWLDQAALDKYYERAAQITPNLIGRVSPEIKMKGLDNKEYTLSGIKAKYTLVVFWDPTCGHCTTEIPALDSLYKAVLKNKGVKVYAVKTEGDEKIWKDFIDKHQLNDWTNVYDPEHTSNYRAMYDVYSTPVLYVLDEKKIIRGKRLDHNNVLSVIEMLEKKSKDAKKSKS